MKANKLSKLLSVSLLALIGSISTVGNADTEANALIEGYGCIVPDAESADDLLATKMLVITSEMINHGNMIDHAQVVHDFSITHEFDDVISPDTDNCTNPYQIKLTVEHEEDGSAVDPVNVDVDSVNIVFAGDGTSSKVISNGDTASNLRLTLNLSATTNPNGVAVAEFSYQIPIIVTARLEGIE